MIDTHCHPQFAAYDQDREEMIQRQISAGVFMIAVGTMYETSKTAVELVKKYPQNIRAAVGIHPYHITKNFLNSPEDPLETQLSVISDQLSVSALSELAKLPEVVAIGESGLDYFYLEKTPLEKRVEIKEKQRENFLEHIALARELKKPLIIHSRKAYGEIVEIMREANFPHGAVMHFFQGTIDEARKFLELGAYISFAGPITFSAEYDDVIQYIPLDRIVVETDAPYAAPSPYRGRRNEPQHVKFVLEAIAKIKKQTFEETTNKTSENSKKLFGISQKRD
jgi:TatD DNase family protein